MSYKKQDFVDGKVLKAEQLCHIENGISTIIEGDSAPVQLFDKAKMTANTYLNSAGAEVAVSPNDQGLAWYVTDYMSVDDIDVYYYTNLDITGTAPHSAFYDKEKNLLSVFKQIQGEKISLSIPTNVKFVRFSVAVVSGVCRF